MGFSEALTDLSKTVVELGPRIQTEEATKTSFIMPFFKLLGYDIFNPLEFVPEYTAGMGIKKGEKVDYAILIDDKPVILVEAKCYGEDLEKHDDQLFRYFTSTSAKFGILTDGRQYRFFTDLDKPNIMDQKPFFTFDITRISDQDVEEIKKFQKSQFEIDSVFSTAKELKYTNQIKWLFNNQMENLDDNFIKYILGEIYEGRQTHSIIEQFRPIITKALDQFLNEVTSERLLTALNKSKEKDNDISGNEENEGLNPTEDNLEGEEGNKNKIVTTIDELEAYAIVKAILHDTLPADRIFYRDTLSYFSVLCDNKNYKWVCRLKVERANKYIIFPDETSAGQSYPLETINNIFDYKDKIIESAKRFIE